MLVPPATSTISGIQLPAIMRGSIHSMQATNGLCFFVAAKFFIFSILTIILTFPVILDFASEAAGFGCYDKCHMMWRFWWTDFSFENGLDFQHSNYIFYPDGVDIGGNMAYFTTFIGFLLVQFLDYVIAWNIIWFLGLVFGGYGCYLLANNFNKNLGAVTVAGFRNLRNLKNINVKCSESERTTS